MSPLSLHQGTRLEQRLLPRQIQFAALMELPISDLEERVALELEQNPFLEQASTDVVSLEQAGESSSTRNNSETDDGESLFELFLADDTADLRSRLVDDFHLLDLTPTEEAIGETIIGNLDDDGYLRISNEELISNIKRDYGIEVEPTDIEEVRKRIMQMDPAGIGARDIRESLLAQLRKLHEHTFSRKVAIDIVEHYYEAFIKKHYEVLAKKLDVDDEDIRKAYRLIVELNPKPGNALGRVGDEHYLKPDIFLEEREGELMVLMNDGALPRIRMNNAYNEAVKTATAETQTFLREKRDAAQALVEGITRRREMLKRIVASIVGHQKEYLRGSEEHLRPLTYAGIAQETGIDETLVSRAVRGKYMQTRRGVKPLRSLFTESLTLASGEDVATEKVRSRLRELIDAENKNEPLSDEALMKILLNEGINIARRTVAKYREAMGIPVARLRRE